MSGAEATCPRCGTTGELSRFEVCAGCAAALGWDPECAACLADQAGRTVTGTPHLPSCRRGPKGATVTEPGPDLLAWRTLRGTDLVQAMLSARWHAVEDDQVGGWAVMPTADPPSAGYPQIGGFLSQEIAEHIARQHNDTLEAP